MKEMLNTLQVLEQLNRASQNIIYTDKEIDEEKENIKGIKEIHSRLEKVLKGLSNKSDMKEDAIVEQLIKLHLIYRDFIWQYDLMNDMIKKMIRLYR